jgi:hypothetical protein
MHPDQICEALVREIRDAKRWSAIEEACQALMTVRLMAAQMDHERNHLRGISLQQGTLG